MAKFISLLSSCQEKVRLDFYQCQADAECFRAYECKAAIRIQAWYRGLRVRAYLKHLRECTMLIQRHWRGYCARVYAYQLRKVKVNNMRFCYYNIQAIKIQKVWRGYWSRRHIFNYNMRKKYFDYIRRRNEEIRTELDEMAQDLNMQQMTATEQYREAELQRFAYVNHHLVSTIQQPGIYNSPYQLHMNELEHRMRRVKVTPQRTRSRCDSSQAGGQVAAAVTLPPLPQKPQGPFRDPYEVRYQRERPLSPTLRTSDEYDVIKERRNQQKDEEWAKRITSEMFERYTRPVCGKQYERLLSSSAAYTPLGAVSFRDEIPYKWTAPCQDFRRVLPPIAVFDKLNKTYSKS